MIRRGDIRGEGMRKGESIGRIDTKKSSTLKQKAIKIRAKENSRANILKKHIE